jgi:hypothetical protein
MDNVGAGYRPPIVVGDSPPYEFYAEFSTFYDAIKFNVGCWEMKSIE